VLQKGENGEFVDSILRIEKVERGIWKVESGFALARFRLHKVSASARMRRRDKSTFARMLPPTLRSFGGTSRRDKSASARMLPPTLRSFGGTSRRDKSARQVQFSQKLLPRVGRS
jgi:hypothetical protein